MAKDFAFMFYPGDYLRDTQCLSEKAQVAYDRIMCEHMRKICITQEQHTFFTKRLNSEERQELDMVLSKVDGGFQIDWVVESINKRLAYSDSRRNNRTKKEENPKRDMNNISKVMESEYESEYENNKEAVGEIKKRPDVTIPKKVDFLRYCEERCATVGYNWAEYEQGASTKYDAWVENGWKDLKGNPINGWKGKVVSNLEFFKGKVNGYSHNSKSSTYQDELNRQRENYKPLPQ